MNDTQLVMYDEDYRICGKLADLARKHRVALVVVHHLRKLPADDPLDEVSGTTGLTGAADGIWILKRARSRKDGKLIVTGRDIGEQELKLTWNAENGTWAVTAQDEAESMSESRRTIIGVLTNSAAPMTPAQVVDVLGRDRNAVKQLMWKMALAGQIEKLGEGQYVCRNHNNP